jgi:hypothetical protein
MTRDSKHAICNELQKVIMNAELIERTLTDKKLSEEIKKRLEAIMAAAFKAAELAREK